MRTTGLSRKFNFKLRRWKADYLSTSVLQQHLMVAFPHLHGRLLDLGCGNSPYRPLLTNISSYVPYDIDATGSKPAVVGMAERLPFAENSFDSILSTQVLEHVAEPWHLLEEVARVLRPNGRLLLSAPQAWRLHEEPYDYYRYTHYGLRYLLKRVGLDVISYQPLGGTWLLIGQIMNNALWRTSHPKYSAAWWGSTLTTSLINLVSPILDRTFYDPADTINYLVLAQPIA